jgi:hypothetical protein
LQANWKAQLHLDLTKKPAKHRLVRMVGTVLFPQWGVKL